MGCAEDFKFKKRDVVTPNEKELEIQNDKGSQQHIKERIFH